MMAMEQAFQGAMPNWAQALSMALIVTMPDEQRVGDAGELHNALERACETNPAKLDCSEIKGELMKRMTSL